MRHSFENDLNALSSWLLGITGVSLILIPFHFGMITLGVPQWALWVLGALCYLTALSNQSTFVLTYGRNRILLSRSLSILLQLVLTLLLVCVGYFIEGLIFGFVGIMQLVINTPLKNRFTKVDSMRLIFVLAGFSSGVLCQA